MFRRGARGARGAGEAALVDPMKPVLKAPGPKRLKPNYDNLLSNVAFKFNLRRYIMIQSDLTHGWGLDLTWQGGAG